MKTTLFFLFVSFLFLTNFSASPLYLYSRLAPTATNQYGTPLANVSFVLECQNSDYPYMQRNAQTTLCKSGSAGQCFPEVCYECVADSVAKIYAYYYSAEKEHVISWQGSAFRSGIENSCHYFLSSPRNLLRPFVFETHSLSIRIISSDEQFIPNSTVTGLSVDSFSFICITNEEGFCKIEDIPSNSIYSLNAEYKKQNNKSLVILDADKEIVLKIPLKIQSSVFQLAFNTTDQNGEPLPNIPILLTTQNGTLTYLSDENGSVVLFPLNQDNYSWKSFYAKESRTGSVNLLHNQTQKIVFSTSLVSVNTSNFTTITNPGSWFDFLMDKTDQLISKHQNPPKLKLVFVPIGYDDSEYKEFEVMAKRSIEFFVSITPLKECLNSSNVVESFVLKPSICNLNSCNDIMGTTTTNENCQKLVQECAKNEVKDFDKIVGLCKDDSCGYGTGICGAADDIPSGSVISNTFICDGAPYYETVGHELGHAFGLYHIQSQYGLNGCTDNEKGACKEPNAVDCMLPALNRSKIVMAYCPNTNTIGSSAYQYLKNNGLKKYLGGCK